MSLFPEDAPYRVLARKYRPAAFDALIGQEAVVTTLANAIARNRLAQAWLLTGVRGVGKTSTARIIAKALTPLQAQVLQAVGALRGDHPVVFQYLIFNRRFHLIAQCGGEFAGGGSSSGNETLG